MFGLLTGSQIRIPFYLLIAACLFLFAVKCLFVFKGLTEVYSLRWVFGFLVYLFLFVSGILLSESESYYTKRIYSNIFNSKCFIAKIISEPQQKNKTFKLIMRIIGFEDSNVLRKCNIKILAYIHKDFNSERLTQGDIIVTKTLLRQIQGPDNPYEFDYKRFMYYNGIAFTSYIKAGTWKLTGHSDNLKTYSVRLRNHFLGLYRKYGFENDEFAVLSALTLGYRDELSTEIKRSFSNAGIMHILAVSGLHTGIVFYVLNFVFGFLLNFRYGKTIRLILVILALWIYAFLTGASITVIRASAMFSLIHFGKYIKRTVNIYNIIAALVFFLLVFNPFQVFDMGFQLSFLAVLSIIFFQHRLYKLLTFKSYLPDRIWILFTASISAQIGTFPVVIYYFHHFPSWFWLTNIIILPLVALVIYLAILLFILSPIPQVALFVSKFLNLVLMLINSIAHTVNQIPFSLIDGIYNSLTETIMLYAIIISLSIYIISKNKFYLLISMSCIICFLSLNLYKRYNIYRQREIVIFNIRGYSVINFIRSRNNLMVTGMNPAVSDKVLHGSVKNYWIRHGVSDRINILNTSDLTVNNTVCDTICRICCCNIYGNPVFSFGGKRILLLCNSKLLEYVTHDKFRLDYIIITGNQKVDIRRLTGLFNFKKIIIDSSNNHHTEKHWKEECRANMINPHITSESGAFVLKL
jgi:competence protein ComEC